MEPAVVALLALGLNAPGAGPTTEIAMAQETVVLQEEVITVAKPCDDGTPYVHNYGSFTMQQYGFQSCPVPLF